MRSWKVREPAGNILFIEREGCFREPDQRIEDSAPSDFVVVERVEQMTRADRIFGQDQQATDGIPDGKCPIANKFGEATDAPFFVGYRSDGNVRIVDC